MAAITKTKICNLALMKIGQARISSLDQTGSKQADACNLAYDQMVLETLDAHNWGFARKRATLALVETQPNDYWGYSYQTPSDMVRARSIATGSTSPAIPYEIEGGLIYTDEDAAVLVYTTAVDAPSLFTSGFVQVLVLRLALELATVLLDSETATMDLYKLHERTLRTVTARDSGQQVAQPQEQDIYVSIRS